MRIFSHPAWQNQSMMNHAHWAYKEETFYTYLQQKIHFFDYYAIIVKVRGYIYKEKKSKYTQSKTE